MITCFRIGNPYLNISKRSKIKTVTGRATRDQYLSKGSRGFLQVVFHTDFSNKSRATNPSCPNSKPTNGWPTTIVPSSCRASADLYSSPYRLTSAFWVVMKFAVGMITPHRFSPQKKATKDMIHEYQKCWAGWKMKLLFWVSIR